MADYIPIDKRIARRYYERGVPVVCCRRGYNPGSMLATPTRCAVIESGSGRTFNDAVNVVESIVGVLRYYVQPDAVREILRGV